MFMRLIFIITVVIVFGAIARMGTQLLGFFGNNGEIFEASSEVHEIVRVIYIDFIAPGRRLTMDQSSFMDYLRTRVKVTESKRDPSLDPWSMPYRITINPDGSYEIRSAGPDQEYYTSDDIVAEGGT